MLKVVDKETNSFEPWLECHAWIPMCGKRGDNMLPWGLNVGVGRPPLETLKGIQVSLWKMASS